MEILAVNGKLRTGTGKKEAKKNRKEGLIPAVLYGQDGLSHFTTTEKDVKNAIYTPDFKVIELNLDGTKHRAILKDIQFHPVTEKILHLDFLQLVDGVSVKLQIPIRFKGTSPGMRLGGKLQQNIRRVEVKTVPENMVSELYVDISGLELGQSARVRDLELPDGIEVMTSGSIPVGTVEIPRALRSATAAEEKEAEEAAATETAAPTDEE